MTNGLRYYDSSTPPAPWQAQEMWLAGARVYGGYLSGPQAAHIWTPAEWSVPNHLGYSMVGYVVARGAASGAGYVATQAARIANLDPRRFRICIDQEAGWPDPDPSFATTVRRGGYQVGIYGTPADVARQRAAYDFAVVADYDDVPDPPAPPARTIRQNWNTHTEFGMSVDRGIADPWFYYGVNEMQYMDKGAPLNNADLTARRVQIHEWTHIPGANPGAGALTEAEMEALLATWVQSGGEAVFAAILGA